MGTFNTIPHFKFWCQKVLPLVYDDSLSYMELLSKVISYLNHIIDDVNQIPDFIKDYLSEEKLEPILSELLDELREQIARANEGKNTTASFDRTKGELVWLDDKLIRMTRNILAGDRYIETSTGVTGNFVYTSIEEEMKTIASSLSSVTTTLNNEIVNREAADDYLHGLIDAEVEARESDISSVESLINTETTNRESADNYLHGLIDTEVTNREAADNYLHDQINPNKRVYMFVGDSYAEAHYSWESNVVGWCDYCKSYLGLSNSQYLANFAGATGFCTQNKWYDMINNYVVPEGVEVTDIVIGGGYNDKDYTVSQIMTAIASCATMIRTKYPMARVWLAFMGWDCRDAQWLGLMNAKTAYIQGAGANGWNYIANVDWLGHNYTDGVFYTTTGDSPFGSNFHPNNNGEKSIARAISTVLRGGQFEDFRVLDSCDLTAVTVDGVTATPSYEQLFTSCVNGMLSVFSKHVIEVNYSSNIDIITDGRLYPIGKFASGLLHGDANEQTICRGYVVLQKAGSTNLAGSLCDIVLKEDTLYFRYFYCNAGGWTDYTDVFRVSLQKFEAIGIDRTRI